MEQTINYRGYKIEIVRDEYAENPREIYDCSVGKLFTAHKKYQPQYNFRDMFSPEEVWDENKDIKPSFLENYYAANVYLLDHSGLSVSLTPFSNHWDSGLFGIICCLKRDAKCLDFFEGLTDSEIEEKIMYYFKHEIKTLDDYYAGDVYGFIISDEDGEDVDSCYGFYGNDKIPEIIGSSKHAVDVEIKYRSKKFGNQLQLNFNS